MTRTHLHKLNTARAVSTTPEGINVRGICADLKRLRGKYKSPFTFNLKAPAPKPKLDDGD